MQYAAAILSGILIYGHLPHIALREVLNLAGNGFRNKLNFAANQDVLWQAISDSGIAVLLRDDAEGLVV